MFHAKYLQLLCSLYKILQQQKPEGYDTQNQQIYSSKGGPNVMERLRVCGMLFLVNLNNLKGKAAMNRRYCMEELTFLSSVKGGYQLWLGWELLVCWCIGQFSIFCWPSISVYLTSLSYSFYSITLGTLSRIITRWIIY